jgi:mannose/fructose-specific phosphotransferase system component IIA
VFRQMLQMIPGLEARLMSSSEEEIVFIADLVGFSIFHAMTRAETMYAT